MSEWISVDEKLPVNDELVLVFSNCSSLSDKGIKSHRDIANYNHKYKCFSNEFNWLVTHWMPLPKPPEKK